MIQLFVSPPEEDEKKAQRRRRYQQPKGRRFSSILLARVSADHLWEGGSGKDTVRPVYLQVAGLETELRPFLANMRKGRKADVVTRGYVPKNAARYELLKSAGYAYSWQKGLDAYGACAVTAWLQDLCLLDPGMVDPGGPSFLLLTPRWWAEAEEEKLRADRERCRRILTHARHLFYVRGPERPVPPRFELSDDEVLGLVPQAVRFADYLDRRTRRPIPPRPEFLFQLYLAALFAGVASLAASQDRWAREDTDLWHQARHCSGSFVEEGTAEVGLLPAVACQTNHAQLDELLAAQVALFFKLNGDR